MNLSQSANFREIVIAVDQFSSTLIVLRAFSAMRGASPLSPTNFKESKPQQTGTGLLIRHGEVATTSGSTNSLPGHLIVGQRPLKARMLVRFQPRQPVLASRASTRPMVIAIREANVSLGETNSQGLGSPIESRLAYTQKSEGQNLSGRPLPRCIIRSAPVSDTGGPGAKPGEATSAFGELPIGNDKWPRSPQQRANTLLR